MSTKKKSTPPRKDPVRVRFVATYTVTKKLQVDAYSLAEAQREVDDFLVGIHGPTEIINIKRDS